MDLLFILIVTAYCIVIIKFSNSIYYYNNIKVESNFQPNVSIVISARNEEKNIGNLIDLLLKQDYPKNKIEILVANDRSIDNTEKILKAYSKNNINIKELNIYETPIGWANKKWALNQLIDLSKSDIILQIDADCIPTKMWVKTMTNYFCNNNVGFVAGCSPLIHNDKFLNNLFQMESLVQEAVNAGAILNNMVLSCTGRNIAFRKKYFDLIEGYAGNEHISSGDDDLLLQKMAIETNCIIRYSINENSLVDSYAPYKFSDFINQRLRFASKAFLYYKIKTTFELKAISILIYLTNMIFLISCLLVLSFYSYFFLVPIILKMTADLLFSFIFMLKVKRNWSFKSYLILTALYPLYVILFGTLGPLIKVDWKK